MADFSEKRARIVEHLASALWHTTQEGSPVSADIVAMLEHRIRDALRDGDCPACVELQLTKDLDKAVDRE